MTRSVPLAGAALLGCLLFPVAASAATTYTVDPAAAAGCSAAAVCKTITDANAKVADGDTVTIKAGAYAEAPIVVTKKNVTFVAADPGKVYVQTSSTTAGAATLTLGDGSGAGSGTVVRGLSIGVPPSGGQAVLVETAGTTLDGVSLGRVAATADTPVYAVDDSGTGVTTGTNTIKSTLIAQVPTLGAAGSAPAVDGGTRTSLVIQDTNILSGPNSGPGVTFNGNDATGTTTKVAVPNLVSRGAILTQQAAVNAVEVVSAAASAVPKAVVLDSVLLSPGTSGAGLHAASLAGNALQGATAGNVAVTAHHVTIAAGARPFALEANALSAPFLPAPLGTPAAAVGQVAVTADHSILHGAGASTVTAAAGSTTQTGSTARLTIADSDTTDAAGGTTTAGTTVSGATTNTPDATLFADPANRNFHLKSTAPVIDKGGPQVSGESATDFEGQPRVTGPASDLGADEYVNTAPTALLRLDKPRANQGDTVNFDATGSGDADGSVTTYAFNFGDGSPAQTNATGRTAHQFTKTGTFTVTLGVLDNGGGTAIATATVTVVDGTPPVVVFTGLKSGAKLKLFSTKTKKKALTPKAGRKRTQTTTTTSLRKVLFTGTASDASGVKFVELSFRRVSLAKSKAKVGTVRKTTTAKHATPTKQKAASRAASKAAVCTFLDQKKKRFTGLPCTKPVFFAVQLKNGKFSFQLKKDIPYRLGSYVVSARATDANGIVSAPVSVPFTLR